MDEVLFRTALSPGIREQHDEFPLIADPSGKMVVGQFGLSIPDFLDGFEGDIGEGDVLLTSDPYACGAAISHANDWLVVLPIYVDGRVVGWASMFGHMSDVGGKTRARCPPTRGRSSRRACVIPPFRLYSAGSSTRTRCASSSTRCACRTGTGPTSAVWSPRAAPRRAGCRRCARASAPTPTSPRSMPCCNATTTR